MGQAETTAMYPLLSASLSHRHRCYGQQQSGRCHPHLRSHQHDHHYHQHGWMRESDVGAHESPSVRRWGYLEPRSTHLTTQCKRKRQVSELTETTIVSREKALPTIFQPVKVMMQARGNKNQSIVLKCFHSSKKKNPPRILNVV